MLSSHFPLFVVFLFYTGFVNAQPIKGLIIDATTKKGLPYVQIGIQNKNIGTLSDEQGYFVIETHQVTDTDSLLFSYLGYEQKIYSIQQVKSDSPIFLQEIAYSLPAIDIQASSFKKTKKFGYKRTTSKQMTTGWGGISSNYIKHPIGERGARIKFKGKTALLKNLYFHIADNEFDSVSLRVHLYTIKNDLPDKEIIKKNVFVTTSTKYGWVKVPLSQLQLVTEEDLIATIEWVGY